MEFTFTEAQFAQYEQVRNLLAHKNFLRKSTTSVADVLETAFVELLKVLKPEVLEENKIDPSEKWKSLTPKRKQVILQQEQRCQYVNYETGKACGSRFNLEIDHIIPRKAGGSNDPGNLRVLCRQHNQFREKSPARNPQVLL